MDEIIQSTERGRRKESYVNNTSYTSPFAACLYPRRGELYCEQRYCALFLDIFYHDREDYTGARRDRHLASLGGQQRINNERYCSP